MLFHRLRLDSLVVGARRRDQKAPFVQTFTIDGTYPSRHTCISAAFRRPAGHNRDTVTPAGVSANMSDAPRSEDGDGKEIDPQEGSFPIVESLGEGRFRITGTGFWLTTYGLFVTAKHVIEHLAGGVAYAFQPAPDDKTIFRRRITQINYLNDFDLAVGQADNSLEERPEGPLMNRRPILSGSVPPVGSRLVTYAYPENRIWDRSETDGLTLVSDFYEGEFLREVAQGESPLIPHAHYETSIEIHDGASGGPVFDENGRVIGVNSRSWDFGEDSEEGHLSSILPVGLLAPIPVSLRQLPPQSWEAQQMPEDRRGADTSVVDLVRSGHILWSS